MEIPGDTRDEIYSRGKGKEYNGLGIKQKLVLQEADRSEKLFREFRCSQSWILYYSEQRWKLQNMVTTGELTGKGQNENKNKIPGWFVQMT